MVFVIVMIKSNLMDEIMLFNNYDNTNNYNNTIGQSCGLDLSRKQCTCFRLILELDCLWFDLVVN